MIAWQNPAALIGLVALAGPIAIHLLRRRRAARVPFPTDRFIHPTLTGAVRLRRPADMWLLALRIAILAIAVCAFAQPVIVTRGRVRAWDATIARAIVVDASESMTSAAAEAEAAVEEETRNVATAVRIEATDLAQGIRRAVARLTHAAPARREVVVVSDFQHGAVVDNAFAAVPASLGVRLVRVGGFPTRRTVPGAPLFGGDAGAWRPEITVELDRTTVVFVRTGSQLAGLTIASGSDADRAGLLKAVASSGTPAPAPEQPVVLTFGVVRKEIAPLGSRWMLETVLRLRRDAELARLSDGGAAVDAGESDGALVINVSARPDSFAAAAVLRGVLAARQGDAARVFSEHEIRTIDDAQLKAWARPAPAIDAGAWRYAQENDARWFWIAVVVLLACEMGVRARVKL